MRRSVFALLAISSAVFAQTHTVKLGKHTFTLPKGFTIELVAESPQVDRPVTAAFDDKGRLFVADSSGSNAKPADQLKNPTHRVVMLESTKKDGRFDKSTVFADKLSFLQGTMWRDGSLYVATPPTIQKLTDTDNDGVADKREVWFDGGVLTGCANDVHGPYPGPDGRIYFTKGAFAKQELTLGNGKKFTTRAAHIYSAKSDGSDIRVEMTGGMDNPVDVAFNTAGELFFTTTFLQHPENGRRDGIIHATYGAVFGKEHDVLTDHPRSRPELSEPMTHLGPAAPSGLHCYDNSHFGLEFRDNLFAANFNLSKVTRHVLKEKGSTYETADSDFVVSDNRDFHPTDVIEDTDGSLLILDTGGWYKLCCPSSVMEKKDVLGAIYRVRKAGAKPGNPNLPPARNEYPKLTAKSFRERRLAAEKVGKAGDERAIPDLFAALADETNDKVLDTALTRALIDIDHPKAVSEGLKHPSDRVKRAALAAVAESSSSFLKAADVVPHLTSTHPDLKATAWWVAGRHPEWGDDLVGCFRAELEKERKGQKGAFFVNELARFAGREPVQKLMAEYLTVEGCQTTIQLAMLTSRLKGLPDCWEEPIAREMNLSASLVATLGVFRGNTVTPEQHRRVVALAEKKLAAAGKTWTANEREWLLAFSPVGSLPADDDAFTAAVLALKAGEGPLPHRDALTRSNLTAAQLEQLALALPDISPFHWPDLFTAFARTTDAKVGEALTAALRTKRMKTVVRVEQVKPILDKYPQAVQELAAKLYADLEEATKEQRAKLDTLLKDTQPGDVRKGQAVFNSAKAACTACHKVAYVGGAIGPDLTKIGGVRGEKDLLEAIVFPSASFVRSYEPVKVEMKDGKSYNGILKADTGETVTLTVSATEEVRVSRKDIDEMKPGAVSVMPAGLDQQLTKQELADLVAFLKSLK